VWQCFWPFPPQTVTARYGGARTGWRNWQTDDGLPQNPVWAIAQRLTAILGGNAAGSCSLRWRAFCPARGNRPLN